MSGTGEQGRGEQWTAYFGYGAHLLADDFLEKSRAAEVIGPAALQKHELAFTAEPFKRGFGGHPTIRPCAVRWIPGILYAVPDRDWPRLDREAGIYHRLVRRDVQVEVLGGGEVGATTYVMGEGLPEFAPEDWIRRKLQSAYERYGFDPYILETALDRADAWAPTRLSRGGGPVDGAGPRRRAAVYLRGDRAVADRQLAEVDMFVPGLNVVFPQRYIFFDAPGNSRALAELAAADADLVIVGPARDGFEQSAEFAAVDSAFKGEVVFLEDIHDPEA